MCGSLRVSLLHLLQHVQTWLDFRITSSIKNRFPRFSQQNFQTSQKPTAEKLSKEREAFVSEVNLTKLEDYFHDKNLKCENFRNPETLEQIIDLQ